MSTAAATAVETVYRAEWGRIVATLIGLIGDFDLAEECAQEAFAAAVEQWKATGVPALPRAWIIQTARNKAIDRIRRQGKYAEKLALYGNSEIGTESQEPNYDTGEIPDDRLRLIFTCCHPALALEAQVMFQKFFAVKLGDGVLRADRPRVGHEAWHAGPRQWIVGVSNSVVPT